MPKIASYIDKKRQSCVLRRMVPWPGVRLSLKPLGCNFRLLQPLMLISLRDVSHDWDAETSASVTRSQRNAFHLHWMTLMFKRAALVVVVLMTALTPSLANPLARGDFGQKPWAVNLDRLTLDNRSFRSTQWTGRSLQMTVMSLQPGEEIGLEKHDQGDQFIRVEQGVGRVVMGATKDQLTFERQLSDGWAVLIPGGYWHNIINSGLKPLKVYVIYAPPEHPAGTVHNTSKDAEADHGH
ncbi:MAG: cupin domain-containing protein [Vulcanococcus sp.]